jgi:hypothetical protein
MTDRDDGRLPQAAEAMLRGWPAPSRRDAYWEDRADAVLAEIQSGGPAAGTPDVLLAAPLPAEAGEGSFGERSWSRASVPPGPSPSMRSPIRLADLARAAVEPGGEEDDRLAVAKQTLSHAARVRHTGELASQAVAAASAPTRGDRDIEEVEELTDADEIDPPSQAPAAKLVRPRKRRWWNASLVVGSTVGFLGMAAGTLIFLYTIQHPVVFEMASSVGVKLPVLVGPASPAEAPQAVAIAGDSHGRSATGKPAGDLAPSEGQPPPQAKPASDEARAVAAAPKGAGRWPAAKTEEKKSSKAGEEVAVNEEPEPPPPAAAPEPEPKKAEPKKPEPDTYSDRLPPAQDESRPLEPSLGAAMSAIQKVMPNARSCLAGQSAPSSATVTFGSDGRVRNVAVSGPSANSSAVGCIRSALSAARVSPFAKPTFSIPATVRPP